MAELTTAQQAVVEVLEEGPAPIGLQTADGRVNAAAARALEAAGLVEISDGTATLAGAPVVAAGARRGARLPLTRRR